MLGYIPPNTVWDFTQFLIRNNTPLYTLAHDSESNVRIILHMLDGLRPFVDVCVGKKVIAGKTLTQETCESTIRGIYLEYLPNYATDEA